MTPLTVPVVISPSYSFPLSVEEEGDGLGDAPGSNPPESYWDTPTEPEMPTEPETPTEPGAAYVEGGMLVVPGARVQDGFVVLPGASVSNGFVGFE